MTDLEVINDFALVVAHGGFGKASRASGRSKATLSRRVAKLEMALGVRLIVRGSRALQLTVEGASLYGRVDSPLREIEDAVRATVEGEEHIRGHLRISSAVVFAHVHLSRIAAAFLRTHAGVQLEIVADDRIVDPVDDHFDLVIRANPAPDARLFGRRLFRTERVVVAAPGVPEPSHGDVIRVVSQETMVEAEWRLRRGKTLRTVRPHLVMSLSSLMMLRDAALIGAGAALLPRYLVADDLDQGRLQCWGRQDGVWTEVWVLYASNRLVGRKVRAFLEHLVREFSLPARSEPRESIKRSSVGNR